MVKKDIRWIQRFNNFVKALNQLTKFINAGELNELEKQGLIQSFEYTHELAWKTIKDFLEDQGVQEIYGSKNATREAFKLGLLENGEVWMDMIKSRNLTSHTYNEDTTEKITHSIVGKYFEQFNLIYEKFSTLKQKEESE